MLRSALGDLRVFAATADSPGGGPPGGAEAAAPTAAAAAAAVYLEGTAAGREGGAADTLVGRVVPADGVGAPAGAVAVADEEAYLYAEEFWVDGDEVDGVYVTEESSEVDPGL